MRQTPRAGSAVRCRPLILGLLSLWLLALPATWAQQPGGGELQFASVEQLQSLFEEAMGRRTPGDGPDLVEVGRALLTHDSRDLYGDFDGDLVLARVFHKLPREARAQLAPFVGELGRSVPLYFAICAQIGKSDAALDVVLRAAALLLVIRFEQNPDLPARMRQEVSQPSRFALEGLAFTLRHSTLMAGAVLDEALAGPHDALLLIALRGVRPVVLTQARLQRVGQLVTDAERELELRRVAVAALVRTGVRARPVIEEALARLPGKSENPRLRAALTKALDRMDAATPVQEEVQAPEHGALVWALCGLGCAAISLGLAVFGRRGTAMLFGVAGLALAWYAVIEPPKAAAPGPEADPTLAWRLAASRLADSAEVYLRAGPRARGRPGFAYASCAADIELGLAFEDLAQALGPRGYVEASLVDESTVRLSVHGEGFSREAAFSCLVLGGQILLSERLEALPESVPPGPASADPVSEENLDTPTLVAGSSVLLVLLGIVMSLRMPPELRRRKKKAAPPPKPKREHATTKLGKAVEVIGKMIEPKEVATEDFLTQSGAHRSQTGRHLRPSGEHPSLGSLTGKHLRSSGKHPSFRVVTRRMERPDAKSARPARGTTGRFRVVSDGTKRTPTGRFQVDGEVVRRMPLFETDADQRDEDDDD